MRIRQKALRLNNRLVILVKTLIHTGLIMYIAGLVYLATIDELGPDPVHALLYFLGISAINLLFVTLAITPLARVIPCGDLLRFRRLLGLYVLCFACLHVTAYLVFTLQLNLSLLGREIVRRPYILVGSATLLILLALGITSVNSVRRRMGRQWQRLHNGVYLALGLALLHYSWAQKTPWGSPLIYWGLALVILYTRRDKWRRWLHILLRRG